MIPARLYGLITTTLWFALWSILFHDSAQGQSNVLSLSGPDSADFVIMERIILDGNKRTHPSIILRELKFHQGDTIAAKSLAVMLTKAKENVFNTGLFNFVTFDTAYQYGGRKITLTIHLIERWYIWPLPYFDFSDQNFNAWWETRDFSRLTYGVDLTFFNVRGRNETLTLLAHFGFNQLFGFDYNIPYINFKQTVGLGFGASYEINHEVVVQSAGNKPVYYKDPANYPKQQFSGYAEVRLRPSIYSTHTFSVAYNHYYFRDTVLSIPGFSLTSSNSQDFVSFYYQFKNDHRDIHFYPLTGYYFDVEFLHCVPYAITHNTWVKLNARKYWQIYNRWYFATGFEGKISFAKEQPYFLQQGLGYGREYVRGYEYYIIDGQHFALLKNNFKFAIVPQRVIKLAFLKSQKFNTVPLALYLNIFADFGYVYSYMAAGKLPSLPSTTLTNDQNSLQNKLEYGYGVGVDFTTYYDIVLRMEFAMNGFGKPGFYLHFVAPI